MGKYTCTEYREEMLLLALRQQLKAPNLTSQEKKELLEKIEKMENQMKMD